MRPDLIIHNSVSLDGSITGFEPDLEAHYGIVGSYGADAMLVGSVTADTGLTMFHGDPLPEEEPGDRTPTPDEVEGRGTLWVIPDSGARLLGKLHLYRRSEFCPRLLILVAEKTPPGYLDYLREREIPFRVVGAARVELAAALELLAAAFGIRKVLVDAGPTLVGVLLNQGLGDEISLLVMPALAGDACVPLFRDVAAGVQLKRTAKVPAGTQAVHLRYRVG